jgi:hypothetical protein
LNSGRCRRFVTPSSNTDRPLNGGSHFRIHPATQLDWVADGAAEREAPVQRPFLLRSAQRFFIASDRRFLPAADIWCLPMTAGADLAAFGLPGPRRTPIPSRAAIALSIWSLSFFSSATIRSSSKAFTSSHVSFREPMRTAKSIKTGWTRRTANSERSEAVAGTVVS